MPYDKQIPEDEYVLTGRQAPHMGEVIAPMRLLRGVAGAYGTLFYDADTDEWGGVVESHISDTYVPCRIRRGEDGKAETVFDFCDEGAVPIHSMIGVDNTLLGAMSRMVAYLNPPDDDNSGGNMPVKTEAH